MSNTTATPGYLTPLGADIDQDALENSLQEMVVGVTGLAAELVRPRWQAKPPTSPGSEETWCAIGVTDFMEAASSEQHDGAGDGANVVTTWCGLELLATFYGPGSLGMATRLRDGLQIDQNRAQLRAQGLALTSVGEPRNAPDLKNGQWRRRVDLPITMQWETRQEFGVLNIDAASGTIVTDTGRTTKF